MFRYHDITASSFCKLPKTFCSSKPIVSIKNDDNYCFLWCILAHKYIEDNHRETVSHYKKYSHELNQGDKQFSMKI